MPRRWHHDSTFRDGLRQPLDREQRARFVFLLDAHHRAGRLTRAARDVGRAFLKRLGVTGQCDPAHATLAADTGCCERTVRRACDALRALGLLRWTRRLVREGPYVAQTSNAYRLGDGQNDRETRKKDFVSAPAAAARAVKGAMKGVVEALAMPPDNAVARAALARLRAERERKLGLAVALNLSP